MRSFVLFLFLVPVILLGTIACGTDNDESTGTATPTQVPQAEATAEPGPTATGAPATPVPTNPPPTPAPSAGASASAPTQHAPEETMAPGQMYTPTPAPTEAPSDTPTPVPTDLPEPTTAETGPGPGSYIVGEGSEITFTVEEELNRTPVRFDAVISGTGISGFASLDGGPSVITLDLHSLESDQSFRDRFIRDRMFPNTPTATVTFHDLPALPQSFFDGEETEGTLEGSLQIGDTATPLTYEVTARLDPGVVNVLGKTTFTWEQLGLDKPVFGPVAYLADEVRVQVLVIAIKQ